ncbi:hypothetical protein BLA24064_00886 [Burkholderia latens]|uniref:Uncharacterized protein n=1 Tax=Burkholderia latens TaxID=488446 RepID=A0A6P2HZC9_9BURK|nr:hypothetical protein BLA24064_00886 [Burkholderia latens]
MNVVLPIPGKRDSDSCYAEVPLTARVLGGRRA